MVRVLEPADVLALWERGTARHAIDRSALLCAWARPDLPADAIADLPLGAVTASLLRLRETSFGSGIRSHVDCESCGQRLELALDSAALLQPSCGDAVELAVAGIRVRAPSLRDLAAVASEHDLARAARRLLERCAVDAAIDIGSWSDPSLREAEDAIEAADPNADLAFEVRCEACGHQGIAQLDAGVLLWDEIDSRARALLEEVHRLARAYGWTEAEVLALGPARRAAYLSMVDA